MNEIWKDIEGYDGKYQVSNLGRIRSVDRITTDKNGRQWFVKGCIRKPSLTASGYLRIPLETYPEISIHRAVANAFVPGYFEGAQVNHIDENRQNNRWDNLEWVTPKGNINHGSCIKKIQEANERRLDFVIEQYSPEGKLIITYPSQHAAARALNVRQSRIFHVIEHGGKVKGYILKRKNK